MPDDSAAAGAYRSRTPPEKRTRRRRTKARAAGRPVSTLETGVVTTTDTADADRALRFESADARIVDADTDLRISPAVQSAAPGLELTASTSSATRREHILSSFRTQVQQLVQDTLKDFASKLEVRCVCIRCQRSCCPFNASNLKACKTHTIWKTDDGQIRCGRAGPF